MGPMMDTWHKPPPAPAAAPARPAYHLYCSNMGHAWSHDQHHILCLLLDQEVLASATQR